MVAALRLQGVAALALAAPSDGHVDDNAVHAVFQANLEDILGAACGVSHMNYIGNSMDNLCLIYGYIWFVYE